jgi:hypothetical protein
MTALIVLFALCTGAAFGFLSREIMAMGADA